MSVVMLSHLSLARGIYDELPQHLRHIRTAIYSEFGLDLKFFREVPLTSNYESRDGRRLTRLDEDEAMHAKTSSLWVVESKPTGQAMTQVKYRTLLASSNSSSIVCCCCTSSLSKSPTSPWGVWDVPKFWTSSPVLECE